MNTKEKISKLVWGGDYDTFVSMALWYVGDSRQELMERIQGLPEDVKEDFIKYFSN